MSADWPEVRLEEVTSKLGDGLHGTPSYDVSGEYFFINGNNLDNGKIVLDEKTKRATKEEYLKHKKNLNDRTILVSINGTIGNVALYNGEKVFLGKSACYFNVNEGVDKQFIRYVVTSNNFQNYIGSLATGSTIKNVSLKLMRDYTFKLPPIELQKNISKVLEDLDNKIELNRQTNQTLEQIAQAIFKSWFVDFEPVKAKAQVRASVAQGILPGCDQNTPLPKNFDVEATVERAAMCAISGKSLEELEELSDEARKQLKTTAALFSDALVDSELGEIPEGWGIQMIEDVLDLAYGKALKKAERIDGEFSVYGSGGLTGMHNQSLVEGPGIIIGRKGSVGRLYWEDKSFYPIDTVFYVKCKNSMTLPFSYYMLQILGLEDMNTDAAVPGLNRNNVYRLEIPKYSNDLVEEFTNIASNIRKKIKLVREEINTLETIRDSLLPKLLSDDLDINSAT